MATNKDWILQVKGTQKFIGEQGLVDRPQRARGWTTCRVAPKDPSRPPSPINGLTKPALLEEELVAMIKAHGAVSFIRRGDAVREWFINKPQEG